MERAKSKIKADSTVEGTAKVAETNSVQLSNRRCSIKAFLGVLGIALLSLSACNNNRVFEKDVDIPSMKWHKDSVLVFNFEIKDTLSRYNFYYNVRNTLSYPFYNMYVTYYMMDSLNRRISSDLQTFDLLNPKTGKPYGDGLGDIYSRSLLALKNVQFKKPGKFSFKLKHYMRLDPLPEVVSMGLRIEKVPPLK